MAMYKFSVDELLDKPSEAQAIFERNGFIHIANVYSKKSCNEAIRQIEDMEENLLESNSVQLVTESINNKTLVKYYQGIYDQSPAFRPFFSHRLMLFSSILLMSDNIYFADMELHIRNPGGSKIPRHQDNFYFNLANAKGLTAYIALSDHSRDSGGLNYKVNSHKRVINHSPCDVKGFSSYICSESKDFTDLQGETYSPNYMAGDLTIHHPNNIHWSDANPAGGNRGYAISARIFDSDEKIDLDGVERYKRLLASNRD